MLAEKSVVLAKSSRREALERGGGTKKGRSSLVLPPSLYEFTKNFPDHLMAPFAML